MSDVRDRLAKLEKIVGVKLACDECSAVVSVVNTAPRPGPCSACGRERQVIIVTIPIRTRASFLRQEGETAHDPGFPEIGVENIAGAGLAGPVVLPQERPSGEPPSASWRPANGLPRTPRWVPRHEIPAEPPATRHVYDPNDGE